MALTAKELALLRRIIALAQKLIAESPKPKRGRPASSDRAKVEQKPTAAKRIRRSGRELKKFRAMLKAERKKGVPVATLARQHGVSAAYIYWLDRMNANMEWRRIHSDDETRS